MPTRFVLAAMITLAAAPGAFAQPQPGQPIQLKQFGGGNPELFRQSSSGRAADQVILELTEMKTELNTSKLGFAPKAAIANRIDAATASATTLRQLIRQNRPPQELYAAYAELDRAVSGLNATMNQYPQAGPVIGDNFQRVALATQNLGAALSTGDTTPGQSHRWVIRLVETLDDQTEGMRDMLGDAAPPGYDRNIDVTIRSFTRSVRTVGRSIRDTGTLDRARADYVNVLTPGWANVGNQLGRVRNLPAEVRNQFARVDGTFRRLGEVLQAGGGPGPGPIIPPGPGPQTGLIAVGAGEGGGPRVRVFADLRTRPVADFFAYDPEFRGGVRVCMADLNGDGIGDIITAPGPGMQPLIRVFDGRNHSLLVEFLVLDVNWRGGVQVAAADLTRTGQALIAVAPDVGGGPQVQVYDLAQGKMIDSFFAFPQNLRGGVRLAWADINADSIPDLLTVPGPCEHPPEVRIYSGRDRKLLTQFTALDPRWRGGLWVAAADGSNNGRADVVIGADAGGTSIVRVIEPTRGRLDAEWLAYPDAFRGGVRVSCRDLDGDGRPEVICTPGAGFRNVPVRVFGGRDRKLIADFPTFPGFDGGGFVAGR